MKTIQEVKIGDTITNCKRGEGIITNKTKRTITATFKNGTRVKNTYSYNDAYYYPSDF